MSDILRRKRGKYHKTQVHILSVLTCIIVVYTNHTCYLKCLVSLWRLIQFFGGNAGLTVRALGASAGKRGLSFFSSVKLGNIQGVFWLL